MGRKKVPLEYIPNNKSRRETLKKRSKGLTKKAGEVAIMCDTKACVVVYPEGESIPQVFSSHDEAETLLNRFRSMEDHDPFNKKMDQECFLNKSICKLQKQALKSAHNYEENNIRLLLHKAMLVGHAGLSTEELSIVNCKGEVLLKSIRDRITKICGQPPVYVPSQTQAHTPTPNVTGDMDTIGAQVTYQAMSPPIPYVTGNMDIIGASTVYQDQEPSPYVTGAMGSIGAPIVSRAQEPLKHHEECLKLMRSGGGDLVTPICTGFNGGVTLSSNVGFNGNEKMQTFNLGAWFSFPQGDTDPGPYSSAFPPM